MTTTLYQVVWTHKGNRGWSQWKAAPDAKQLVDELVASGEFEYVGLTSQEFEAEFEPPQYLPPPKLTPMQTAQRFAQETGDQVSLRWAKSQEAKAAS